MLCEPFPFILEQTYVDYCIGMKYAQCTLIRTCVVYCLKICIGDSMKWKIFFIYEMKMTIRVFS